MSSFEADKEFSAAPAPKHTPTPWFVSGVRFRMNGGEWHNINRYDEAKKIDENIACVGYDPKTGPGHADAHFIVRAVNSHNALVSALEELYAVVRGECPSLLNEDSGGSAQLDMDIQAALAAAKATP
ncbi:hypothetical protein ACVIYH_009055 [Bradyrhizobium diazoefficiens]